MARAFNGATEKLTVANSPVHQPGLQSYAISLWVKRSRTTSTEYIVSCGNESANAAGWAILFTTGGAVRFRVSDGTANTLLVHSSGLTDTTNWHHLLFVIDRTAGVLKGYIDGSATGFAGSPTDSIASLGTIAPTAILTFGMSAAAVSQFVGSVGSFALLYGRVPTSGEIADLASGKIAYQVWQGYGLVACYPLCGADLTDYAQVYNDAPLVATLGTVVASPVQTGTFGTVQAWDNDMFTDTDGTNISSHVTPGGNAWAYHPGPAASTGTLEIRSNAVCRPASSTFLPAVYLNATIPSRGVARIRADLTLRTTTGLTDQGVGLIAKIDPATNTFIVFQIDPTSGFYRTVLRVNVTTTIHPGEPYVTAAGTKSVVLDVDNTRFFFFVGTTLVATHRTDTTYMQNRSVTPGFRFTGTTEPSPALWSVDNLTVEYPFAIKAITTGVPGSTSVGTYGGFHLPAVLKAQDYVLYFAEARYGNGTDDSVKDFVLYRAPVATPTVTGSLIVVRNDGSAYTAMVTNPTPFVLANGTTVILLYMKYPTGSASFPLSEFFNPYADAGLTGNTGTVWKITSTNQGQTWGSPVEITSQVKIATEYGVYCGPGPGARLTAGPYAGRLICAYGYNTEHGAGVGGAASGPPGCIYSDDNGTTWQRGGVISASHQGEETNIFLLSNGSTLVANCRSGTIDMTNRQFNVSTDGGATWGADVLQPELRSAAGSCFTSAAAAYAGVAYLGPNSYANRERMTLWYGDANADNWSDPNASAQAGRISGGTMLEWATAAYSSVMPLTVSGTDYLICLYNAGNRTSGTAIRWEDRLTVAVVPRTWLGLAETPTGITGTAAGTFGAFTGAASGTSTNVGAAAGSLMALTGAATGGSGIVGVAAGSFGRLGGLATGSQTNTGTASGTFGKFTGQAFATLPNLGTAAGVFGRLTGAALGGSINVGIAAGTFGALTGSAIEFAPEPEPEYEIKPATDYAAYHEIMARLRATEQFIDVRITTVNEAKLPPAEWIPFAGVVPNRSNNKATYDNGTSVRTVTYVLYLVARDEDPEARTARLCLMEAAARNALTGIGYGGFCLYAHSQLGVTVYPKTDHPDQRAEITATFAYIVEGYDAMALTDLYVY